MENNPRVSIGILVRRNEKILLGKRKKYPAAWGIPGGKLEYGETIEECALRELVEETGIRAKNARIVTATNDIFPEKKEHWITIILVADYDGGTVTIREPDKCEEWKWFSWNEIPNPRSSPLENILKMNFSPFTI